MNAQKASVLICCLLLIVSVQISHSQVIATTEDGKKVLLKPDGTWEYIKENIGSNDSFTFRKTNWGMTKELVKKTEETEIIKEDEDVLIYKGIVSNLDCLIAYFFVENKLVRGKYNVIETHTNRNDFISDYSGLKKALAEKYAKPKEEKTVWKNSLYKNDSDNLGFAVSLGHLVFFSKWETNESEIGLYLYGENYEVTLAIEYNSKQLQGLEQKKQKKKTLSDF